MISILSRLILFCAVSLLVLGTLWIALMMLVGLTGLHAGMETRLWAVWAAFALVASSLGLIFSRELAQWSVGLRPLDPSEKWIEDVVSRLAKNSGLRPPEIGVYASFEINAFVTGPTKNRALLAVSRGLLLSLDRDATEGILAHEIAFAANGDMVTLTLLQGLLTATALLPARLIARAFAGPLKPQERAAVYLLSYSALQIAFCPLGALAVNAYSRRRAFRADREGARLGGIQKMRAGLTSLAQASAWDDTHPGLAILKISGRSARALTPLFISHPAAEERLRRLPT